MPEFSFIIPCYKAAEKISKVIGCILDQDFKDFEIICVLDGPDEDTENVLKAFKSVKYKVIEHGGACKARNEGLKMSSGKYVIFTDADVYWRPGMLRIFKEKFDETGIDFIYGGFKWTDMDGYHVPHDFDPYLLTVTNYIDTGNPVKREWVERVGGWDESLKRWQDWDLWLRIVQAGAKGLKIDHLTRDTDFPNKDSISGKDNYAETYHVVRKKHGFPDREICLTSIAAYDHGLRIAKLCGWDFWHNPPQLPNDYKAIYLLGMFPESVQDHVMLFKGLDGKNRDCKYLIHWIGTDVLHMRTMLPFTDIKNLRLMFEKHNVKHFVQCEQNAEEMRELGFDVDVLPLPVSGSFKKLPLPDKFTVAVYDHGGIDQKWHKWLVMELTKAMPDIDFKFYGNKHAVGKDRNTEWLGKVPILDVIKQSSCLLRLTIHDGYPVAPVEFMFSGRPVITNVPDMPYTHHVNLGPVNDDRITDIKQLVYSKIREVQKNPEFPFEMATEYYSKLLSPEKFKERIMEVVCEKAKD